MKLLFNKYTALFALLGVLLLADCDNALTPVSTNSRGAITITVSNTAIGSRTLFPSADFAKYELDFSGPGGLTHAETLLGGQSSITVSSLASGSWTIDVTGYVTIDGTEYAAAQGSGTVTIDGTSQNINIPISATMSGPNGFFSYSVVFPPGCYFCMGIY